MAVTVRPLVGREFSEAIPALSRLRIQIFRDWPYLYDGDLEYEEKYLKRFVEADRAFLAAAFNEAGDIVGAATAAPLSGETEEFRAPFEKAGFDVTKIFYFAESLLLPEYRGQGLGHKFFDAREAHAWSFDEYTHVAFCGVVRPKDHPATPAGYRPLDEFWKKRGFAKLDGIMTEFSWKDLDEDKETAKPMQFWMKRR